MTLLAFSIKAPWAFAGADTNVTYLAVLQASNNVTRVTELLPDVGKLYPQNPDAYLKSVRQAAGVLGEQLNNPNAKQAFTNLFVGMMQKSIPTNEEQAASWVESKRDVISFFLNFDQIRDDKSDWLAIAKFLGEIRSKRIPNYTNQSMMISGLANTPAEKAELQKEVEDNERKKITGNFQSQLWQADSTLTFQLQHGCPFDPPFVPPYTLTYTNFINQIGSAAQFTPEERMLLEERWMPTARP